MCTIGDPTSMLNERPELLLSDMVHVVSGLYVRPEVFRGLIRDHWETVAKIAHQIHDEETAKRRRSLNTHASQNMAGL